MNALPVDELLAPLSEDAPCGADMEYDPAFLALEEAARGKSEQQFGDTVIAAQEPDWRVVFEQASELAHRTRDIRLAVLLARSGAHQHGVAMYASALGLIAGLLERYWDKVFPMLDTDDNNDPTMRLNALAPLVDVAAGLADLRNAVVGGGRSPLTVRQIELAAGKAEPLPDETVPTLDGAVQAVAGLGAEVIAALKQVHAEALRIEAVIGDKVGAAQGPELRPLRVLTQTLASVATQAEGGAAADTEDGAADGSTGSAQAGGGSGSLRTREDVIRTLGRVCDWIERNEPANPAPLLIRRAQRLMGMSFLEIIRDLAPAGIDQVENIAGNSGN
jgi:type VI secretion system protein ImpA